MIFNVKLIFLEPKFLYGGQSATTDRPGHQKASDKIEWSKI